MALEYDSQSNMSAVKGLAPIVIATDTTTDGASVDTFDFGSLTWVISSGVVTDGDYQVLLEESDTDFSGETTVDDADILDGVIADWDFALGDDGVTVRIGVIAKKRFQRCSLVSASTTTGGLFSWVALLGHPKHQPVAKAAV